MVVVRLVFVLLYGLLAIQSPGEDQKLPDWAGLPDEPNVFVVETENFSSHFDVTNSLLPAVRSGVKEWAQRSLGADCGQVIESIPLEEFHELIHQDQEHVHEFRQDYDAATAKRLKADHDDFYRGYVRINVNESFRDQVQKRLNKLRLKNRLCSTLVAAIFTFGLAAIGWTYLYTNRASRGFYISRLRWIAGGLLVGLGVVCYFVSRVVF